MSIPLVHDLTLKELDRDLGRYPHTVPDVWVGTVRLGQLRDLSAFATWALDEMVQLAEDRNKAMQVAVKLGHRLADLEEELAGYEADALRNEQATDYYLENV